MGVGAPAFGCEAMVGIANILAGPPFAGLTTTPDGVRFTTVFDTVTAGPFNNAV